MVKQKWQHNNNHSTTTSRGEDWQKNNNHSRTNMVTKQPWWKQNNSRTTIIVERITIGSSGTNHNREQWNDRHLVMKSLLWWTRWTDVRQLDSRSNGPGTQPHALIVCPSPCQTIRQNETQFFFSFDPFCNLVSFCPHLILFAIW